MDPNYRATEEQWAKVEGMALDQQFEGASCILELRSRIEALEAAQQPQPPDHIADASKMEPAPPAPAAPAEGLVERVAWRLAFENHYSNPEIWRSDACAVIRDVAAWMRERLRLDSADLLEMEIK